MNISSLLIFSVSMALAAIAFSLIFLVVPRHMRSIFRYRLWTIRDEIFDAVMMGDVVDAKIFRTLRRSIEALIIASASVNAIEFAFGPKPPKGLANATKEKLCAQIESLPQESRNRFHGWESRIERAVMLHLFLGTPSGWVCTFFGAIAILVAVVPLGIYELIKTGRNVLWAIRDYLRECVHVALYYIGWRGIFLTSSLPQQEGTVLPPLHTCAV